MPKIEEILVLHHSHTDIGYTHPQPIVWELERRFIEQAIDLCEETADWPEPAQMRWTCETTGPVMHWLEQASTDRVERFGRLAREGRISIGAMLCNVTPLFGLEQLARCLYPAAVLRERFDIPISTAVNHDVNGLPWPITQLLLDAGIEMLVMGINVHFGGYPLRRPLAFRWQAPDGRSLPTFNGEHYGEFKNFANLEEGSTDAMARGLEAYTARLRAADYPYDFIYLTASHPAYWDNGPPDPDLPRLLRQWHEEGREPAIRLATPEMLLERIRRQPQETVPTHAGDWTDFWNFGAASSSLETRINRETGRRLAAAELIQTSTGVRDAHTRQLLERAYWHLSFYDEHTWGASGSVSNPERDDVATQWCLKAREAHEARSLASLFMRDQLEALAGNATVGTEVGGVLLVNAAPVERTVCLRLPLDSWCPDWVPGGWRHCSSSVHAIDVQCTSWSDDNSRIVGPLQLPPSGYAVIPVEDLLAAEEEAAGLESGPGHIESPFHRLEFEPATGRVTGLWDKRLQWEVVDGDSPWSLFGLVHESADANSAPADGSTVQRGGFFDFRDLPFHGRWLPEWPARRQETSSLEAPRVEREPDGITLVSSWSAPGLEQLEQRIKLCALRPVVELSAAFYKKDVAAPESIYFTFPCALPQWRAHFDTAGVPVAFDAEQLPGAVRDWVTVDNWVSMHNDVNGLTLACPDAPLVQIGGFNFARALETVPPEAPALLLAWPLNNYWNTNFRVSQPGWLRFRYELTTHGPFEPRAAALAGLEAANPIESHPVLAPAAPRQGRWVEVADPDVLPMHVKCAEDGDGVIVRLQSVTDEPRRTGISLPGRELASAVLTSTMEQNRDPLQIVQNAAQIDLPPRGCATVRLLALADR